MVAAPVSNVDIDYCRIDSTANSMAFLNALSANPTKLSNTLKQFIAFFREIV